MLSQSKSTNSLYRGLRGPTIRGLGLTCYPGHYSQACPAPSDGSYEAPSSEPFIGGTRESDPRYEDTGSGTSTYYQRPAGAPSDWSKYVPANTDLLWKPYPGGGFVPIGLAVPVPEWGLGPVSEPLRYSGVEYDEATGAVTPTSPVNVAGGTAVSSPGDGGGDGGFISNVFGAFDSDTEGNYFTDTIGSAGSMATSVLGGSVQAGGYQIPVWLLGAIGLGIGYAVLKNK